MFQALDEAVSFIRHESAAMADLEFCGPCDEDVFSWPPGKRAGIEALPTSLDEAPDPLERDHDFLLEGSVFSRERIDRRVSRKRSEERLVRDRPHPFEIELHYDL